MTADQTLTLLRHGYRTGSVLRGSTVAVGTRMLGRRVVLLGGPQGSRAFYAPALTRRRDAVPPPVKRTLFGAGGVQSLDGEAHRVRKATFLQVLSRQAAADLAQQTEQAWRAAARRWADGDEVVVFDEAARVLGVAVCAWAGIGLLPEEAPRRVGDLLAIVDGFGSPGVAQLRARLAHVRSVTWARRLVDDVRTGRRTPPPGSALDVWARAVDERGRLLPAGTAAVDLINVLRPTVAIAWYVSFAALALHEQPQWRDLVRGPGPHRTAFVHEVRRFYPFTPVLGARAEGPGEVAGCPVAAGSLLLLDVHGSDHDPAVWDHPERFDPHRFLIEGPDGPQLSQEALAAHRFIPQGGGDHAAGHRCAGEWVTIAVLETAVGVLADLPLAVTADQDLSYDLSRMPTRPRSGVRMRWRGPVASADDDGAGAAGDAGPVAAVQR